MQWLLNRKVIRWLCFSLCVDVVLSVVDKLLASLRFRRKQVLDADKNKRSEPGKHER